MAKEPIYKNLKADQRCNEEDDYLGDADEMVEENNVCREPLIEQSEDQTASEAALPGGVGDLDMEEEKHNSSATSQYSSHSKFSSSDIPKRETSV